MNKALLETPGTANLDSLEGAPGPAIDAPEGQVQATTQQSAECSAGKPRFLRLTCLCCAIYLLRYIIQLSKIHFTPRSLYRPREYWTLKCDETICRWCDKCRASRLGRRLDAAGTSRCQTQIQEQEGCGEVEKKEAGMIRLVGPC